MHPTTAQLASSKSSFVTFCVVSWGFNVSKHYLPNEKLREQKFLGVSCWFSVLTFQWKSPRVFQGPDMPFLTFLTLLVRNIRQGKKYTNWEHLAITQTSNNLERLRCSFDDIFEVFNAINNFLLTKFWRPFYLHCWLNRSLLKLAVELNLSSTNSSQWNLTSWLLCWFAVRALFDFYWPTSVFFFSGNQCFFSFSLVSLCPKDKEWDLFQPTPTKRLLT